MYSLQTRYRDGAHRTVGIAVGRLRLRDKNICPQPTRYPRVSRVYRRTLGYILLDDLGMYVYPVRSAGFKICRMHYMLSMSEMPT
jgi:hypothetical protein